MILKLKRTPGLFIVGFMGSGKSTVGRALARHLGWRFADLDEDIESQAQMAVPEIFEKFGEEHFRRIEVEALHRRIGDVSRGVPWVIAVGGGCFAQSENMDLIKNHGVSIWLEELYNERRGAYEKADYRVPVTAGGSDAALEEILKFPLF